MIEYDTKQSSNTVSSVAIAGVIAAKIFSGQPTVEQADFNTFLYKPTSYRSSITPPSLDQIRDVITGEYYQGRDPSEGISLSKLNPLIVQLNHWVDSVNIPNKWIQDGIRPPNSECQEKTRSVVSQLLKEHQLYPSRISATIEEGIFVNYINHINKRSMSIEIYNDLDIAAIITHDKEIIISADIANEDFTKIIEIYQAG